ncbi:hypothetical protein A2U01_0045668, partial [Trifolium medium]|nr:hypothetical protein [Trifolium medium]
MRTTLITSGATAKYRYKVSPSTGRVKIGGSDNARLRCCTDFATKRDRAVSISFNDCIDFFKSGVGNSKKVLHLSGIASIPRSV